MAYQQRAGTRAKAALRTYEAPIATAAASVFEATESSGASARRAPSVAELEVSPPLDATAGRSGGWLILVEQGAAWPENLAERLVAAAVVVIVEQPDESRAQLVRRIATGGHKFPEQSRVRTALVIRSLDAPRLHADVAQALQAAVGPMRPLVELCGGGPRPIATAPRPAAPPSRVRLQRPLRMGDELGEYPSRSVPAIPG